MENTLKTRKNKRDLDRAQKEISPLIREFEKKYFEKRVIVDGGLIISNELENDILSIDKRYKIYSHNFNANPKNSIKLDNYWFFNMAVNRISVDKRKYWMDATTAYLTEKFGYDEYNIHDLHKLYAKGFPCHDAAVDVIKNINKILAI